MQGRGQSQRVCGKERVLKPFSEDCYVPIWNQGIDPKYERILLNYPRAPEADGVMNINKKRMFMIFEKKNCFALKMFSCLLNRCESWSWSVNFVTSFQSVYIFILSVRFIYATSFRKYFKKENTQNLRMFFFCNNSFRF